MSMCSYVKGEFRRTEQKGGGLAYANSISPVSAFMDFTTARDFTW